MDPRNLRIGQGYDVHQLVEGRKLIMGGVDIPHTRGLLGHSDADFWAAFAEGTSASCSPTPIPPTKALTP